MLGNQRELQEAKRRKGNFSPNPRKLPLGEVARATVWMVALEGGGLLSIFQA